VRDVLLREAQGHEEQRRAELHALRDQLADAQAHSIAAEDRQERFRRELATEREKASAAIEETKVQRRKLARELKAEHAERTAEFERRKAELKALQEERNTQLERQLAASQEEVQLARQTLKDLQSALEQRTGDLAGSQKRIESLDSEATNLRAMLDAEHASQARAAEELARAADRDVERQQEVAAARSEVELLRSQLDTLAGQYAESDAKNVELNDALGQAQSSLERATEQLSRALASDVATQSDLAAARSRIEELQAEIASLRGELERTRLTAAQKSEDTQRAVAGGAASTEELNAARERIETLEAELARLGADLQLVQAEAARHADELNRAMAVEGADREIVATLRQERDAIAKKLSAAEARLSEAGEGDVRRAEDLERRLQMAVDEMRELKRANSDLESKLAKARSSGTGGPVPVAGLDWEAQKQRLLASLEADEPEDEEQIAERNTIEGTIQITDHIVAQKDEEISELKRRLEEQQGSQASKAATEGAIADILDRDEIIRAERERLQQLQLEWREKIGKAETDLSVERAKIARERAEIADKLQYFSPAQEPRTQAGNASDPSKPARGRWLSMLGLKEVDDKPDGTGK
jgi:chromosome segregation ATPase